MCRRAGSFLFTGTGWGVILSASGTRKRHNAVIYFSQPVDWVKAYFCCGKITSKRFRRNWVSGLSSIRESASRISDKACFLT